MVSPTYHSTARLQSVHLTIPTTSHSSMVFSASRPHQAGTSLNFAAASLKFDYVDRTSRHPHRANAQAILGRGMDHHISSSIHTWHPSNEHASHARALYFSSSLHVLKLHWALVYVRDIGLRRTSVRARTLVVRCLLDALDLFHDAYQNDGTRGARDTHFR